MTAGCWTKKKKKIWTFLLSFIDVLMSGGMKEPVNFAYVLKVEIQRIKREDEGVGWLTYTMTRESEKRQYTHVRRHQEIENVTTDKREGGKKNTFKKSQANYIEEGENK